MVFFWRLKRSLQAVVPQQFVTSTRIKKICVLFLLVAAQFVYLLETNRFISQHNQSTITRRVENITTNDVLTNLVDYHLQEAKFRYPSYSDDPFWFHEKLKHTEDFPISEYIIKETKKIVYWTKDFSGRLGPFGIPENGAKWFKENGCPVWQCEILSSPHNSSIPIEDFDAVIFHDPTWYHPWSNRSFLVPAKRSPHQRYVFLNKEPPGYHTYLKKWDESAGFFNWTISYRWDSDFTSHHGYFRPTTDSEIRKSKLWGKLKNNYAEGKTKMAVWFVSNCGAKNGRLDYVRRLQDHIPVDIYGRCGTLKCPHNKAGECRVMMGRDYKFVIAFENSLCLDYITEKFFTNLKYDIIPIVMDLHGNYARFAPAKSYINALDFPSVKHLANYLKVLDKNDTLYNEYFWWKSHHTVDYSPRGLCSLCSKLHEPSAKSKLSIYANLTKWWHHDAACKVVTFPPDADNDTWLAKDFDPPYESSEKLF